MLLFAMELILDGNSEQAAHVWRKIGLFGGEKIRFVSAPDLNKCLKWTVHRLSFSKMAILKMFLKIQLLKEEKSKDKACRSK